MQTGFFQRPSVGGGVEAILSHTRMPFGAATEDFLSDNYSGPDKAWIGFDIGVNNSDNGGNLEMLPPYTHNGVSYPFGRILVGSGMNSHLVNFYTGQEIQGPPIGLPSDWLNVGHIDEMLAVVPKHTASPGERGWVVVLASPGLGVEKYQEAVRLRREGASYVRDGRAWGLGSVSVNHNLTLQREVFDRVKDTLKREVGLTDEDFREIPVLYLGGGTTHPNTINLLAVGTDMFIPDPESPLLNGEDFVRESTQEILGDLGYDIHFISTSGSYDNGKGGIHCGTNVEYEGVTDVAWWEVEQQ